MDNKKKTVASKTILQLMEILAEESGSSCLGDEFWANNSTYAAELAKRLSLTPTRAVLLSICLRQGPRNVDFDDISRHLSISNIRALKYSDDINALVRAKYLKYRDAKDEDSFDVPVSDIPKHTDDIPAENAIESTGSAKTEHLRGGNGGAPGFTSTANRAADGRLRRMRKA